MVFAILVQTKQNLQQRHKTAKYIFFNKKVKYPKRFYSFLNVFIYGLVVKSIKATFNLFPLFKTNLQPFVFLPVVYFYTQFPFFFYVNIWTRTHTDVLFLYILREGYINGSQIYNHFSPLPQQQSADFYT